MTLERRVLAVAVLGSGMAFLDGTIVNVALPRAQADLGLSDAGRQWVVTAYALAFGSFLLLGGRVADYWGRKRTFLAGLVVFGVGSAWGGLTHSGAELLAARALQGLAAAFLAPAALAKADLVFWLSATGVDRRAVSALEQFVRDGGRSRDVGNGPERVRRRLDPHELGAPGLHGAADILRVVRLDEVDLQPPPRGVVQEPVAQRPIHDCRRHDVVAGLQRHHACGRGRHAGREQQRLRAVLQRGDDLLGLAIDIRVHEGDVVVARDDVPQCGEPLFDALDGDGVGEGVPEVLELLVGRC